MSIHIMAFARSRADLPKASAWAAAIRQAGFALELNVDFDPRTQEVFCRQRTMESLRGLSTTASLWRNT